MKPRIYADFNGYYHGKPTDWVELDTFGTLVDLHHFQVRLVEGLEIIAWDQSDDDEDMEVEGICQYHSALQRPRWCVHFPHGSLLYIPRRNEPLSRPFVCFQCRRQIPDSVRQHETQSCPHCGLDLHFPWMAPGTASA